jgi:hypothetical protein
MCGLGVEHITGKTSVHEHSLTSRAVVYGASVTYPPPEHGSNAESNIMKIFIWRHSKFLSSWSMFDEPHIYRDNYLQAEIAVLAESTEEALELIEKDGQWNIDELRRIEPKVIALDSPAIVSKFVRFG